MDAARLAVLLALLSMPAIPTAMAAPLPASPVPMQRRPAQILPYMEQSNFMAFGQETGGEVRVQPYPSLNLVPARTFQPDFGPTFSGGLSVAAGDVNGDGMPDVIAGQMGSSNPQIKVLNGTDGSEIRVISPYSATQGIIAILIGLRSAPSGTPQLVTAPTSGGQEVKLFNPLTGEALRSFIPFPELNLQGVTVATGDANGDGKDEIITGAGPGSVPMVRVFDGDTGERLQSFLAFDSGFSGGVFVGAGDLDNDGKDEIVTGAGFGGGPHVRVFNASRPERPRFDFTPLLPLGQIYDGSGVRVAAGDVNGDGRADIITSLMLDGSPHVRVYDGQSGSLLNDTITGNPQPGSSQFQAPPTAGAFNPDGDTDGADLLISNFGNPPSITVFRPAASDIPLFPFGQTFTGGVRVATGDIDGDGRSELITARGPGTGPEITIVKFEHACITCTSTLTFPIQVSTPPNSGGATVTAGDLNGDGRAEIIAGLDGGDAGTSISIFSWSACITCTAPVRSDFFLGNPGVTGGVNLAAGDINGDGLAEFVAAAGQGQPPFVHIFDLHGCITCTAPSKLTFPAFDLGFTGGVRVATGDFDGDGYMDIVTAAGPGGAGQVRVFGGGPRGTFATTTGRELGQFLAFGPGFTSGVNVAAGDFNGDGRVDIILGSGAGSPARVRAIALPDTSVPNELFRAFPFGNGYTGGVFVARTYDGTPVTPGSFTTRLMEEEGIFYVTSPVPDAGGTLSMTAGSNLGLVQISIALHNFSSPGRRFLPHAFNFQAEISPTAVVTLCLPYQSGQLALRQIDPTRARLYHETPSGWQDITTARLAGDQGNGLGSRVCGQTSGFSNFVIGGSIDTFVPLAELVRAVG